MSTSPLRPSRLCLSCISVLVLLAASACSDTSEPAASSSGITPSSKSADASDTTRAARPAARPNRKSEGEIAPRNPNERPLPNFEGRTLAGTKLRLADLLGSRVVLFLFNPEDPAAPPVTQAVVRIAKLRGEHNFELVGIGVRTNTSTLSRFREEQNLEFPVIDDSQGEIAKRLRLRAPVAILGMDAEGYMSFSIGAFPVEGDITGYTEAKLRENLRLPTPDASSDGALMAWPAAPALGVKAMSDGAVLETTDLTGRAAVVIFFLHACPHCHNALEAIKSILSSIEEAKRPRLVAISLQHSPGAIRSAMKQHGLDYFDPYLDAGQVATDRWGVTGGVPAIFVLDKQGQIRHRSVGWDEKRDHGMLRMNLTQAAGVRVPMLLDPKGYSGNNVCGVCHAKQHATWQYTKHASTFNTLVTHAADRRTDCISCHVVGFDEPGGYDFRRRPPHLENVGCESCHGRGGPHLSPNFVPDGDYAQICATCHNATHSLGFDFDSFHPRISHTRIATLSNAERSELLGGAGPSRELLPTRADHVGSNACRSCHEAEFKTWEASPHGHAVASLEKQGQASTKECLECHTTAYGKQGGFPAEAPIAAHPDLARVGCESCHGPGSEHIGESAKRIGTILSLGDKCDSCVILKVCGDCHDDANDPGFEFKVEERIDAQRHGTIESAASRDGSSALHPHSSPDRPDSQSIAGFDLTRPNQHSLRLHSDRALLQRVFEELEPNLSMQMQVQDPS
jgi:peroxiredoxin